MSDEYPKVIEVDGLKVTATDAADEARWRATPPKPEAVPDPVPAPAAAVVDVVEPEPVSPLEDVTVEMDNPDFDPPKKTKTAAKKK